MPTGDPPPGPGWPQDEAANAAELFGVERGRLLSLLSALEPGEWDLPTPCPGWSVQGLASHLLGDDLAWLARHRDGHLGPSPPTKDEPAFATWLDGLQADWVRSAQRLSPRLILDLLAWSLPQIVGVLDRQDPHQITASVSWASSGPVPVWLDQRRELSEQWIHRQQLLQALHRPSDLRADIAGPVLDALRWAYPHRLSAAPGPEGRIVTITITGPVSRTWQLIAEGGWWRFTSAGDRPAATMQLTTEQAWRLLTNNLPPADQRRLAVAGDDALVAVLRRTRAIVGVPR